MAAMDQKIFFDAIRRNPFGGSIGDPKQVDGINRINAAWLASGVTDSRWVGYALATVFWETDKQMQPIKEYGNDDYFFRMYDKDGQRPHVARDLGNTEPGDGAKFCGRGYVMITGRANYTRFADLLDVALVDNPDLALDPDISAQIMVLGMTDGLFTGKKLGDYFKNGSEDWVGARYIINGQDRAQVIAGFGRDFNAAIVAAGGLSPPSPDPIPPIPAVSADPELRRLMLAHHQRQANEHLSIAKEIEQLLEE